MLPLEDCSRPPQPMASTSMVPPLELAPVATFIVSISHYGYEMARKLDMMIHADPLGKHQAKHLSSRIKTHAAVLDIMAKRLTDVAPYDARRAAQLAQQNGCASRHLFSEIENTLGVPHRAVRGALVSLNIAASQVQQLTTDTSELADIARVVLDCCRLLPIFQVDCGCREPLDSQRTDHSSCRYHKAVVELLQPLFTTSKREVNAEPQDTSMHRPSQEPSSPMFVHYTISEDHTGNDISIVSARLAALGARSQSKFCVRPAEST